MSDFTYSIPFSNEKLLAGIIYQLKRDNLYDIANLLKGCNVEVEEGGYSHYSGGGRWDGSSPSPVKHSLCCGVFVFFQQFCNILLSCI